MIVLNLIIFISFPSISKHIGSCGVSTETSVTRLIRTLQRTQPFVPFLSQNEVPFLLFKQQDLKLSLPLFATQHSSRKRLLSSVTGMFGTFSTRMQSCGEASNLRTHQTAHIQIPNRRNGKHLMTYRCRSRL